MECPYRFSTPDSNCIETECLSYIIIQKPNLTHPETDLKHIATPYCKLLDTNPTQ